MNIIQKLFGTKIKEKAVSFGNSILINSTLPVYTNWWKTLDYVTNDSIYSIIHLMAGKAASIPLDVYKPKADKNKYLHLTKHTQTKDGIQRLFIERAKALDAEPVDNDLSKLIKQPNKTQGADAFYEGIYSFRILLGESFIWLNRGGTIGGKVLEMYVIPPSMVELVPDPTDPWGILGYVIDFGSARLPVSKEDMIHWRSFNPEFDIINRTHLRGFSPMRAAEKRIQADNDSVDAMVAMFQNGGAKGVLYNETLTDLTIDQQSQLQNLVNTRLNNKSLKAAVASLPGKWGYLNVGLDSVDMNLLSSQELTLKRLCNVFGVPYEMFDSETTFANKEQAMTFFITNTVMPLCYSFRDEINRVLAKDGFFADFDFSMLPELQEDMKKMVETYNFLFDRGIINANEIRLLTNFEISTNPAHNEFYIQSAYVKLDDLNMPVEPVATPLKYNDYDGA